MATAKSLIESIAAKHYMADGAQVEQLAHDVVLGAGADATYGNVLIAHVQSKLGKPRPGRQPPQEPVLDKVHESLYPHVLKGVGPEDLDPKVRISRANFAASWASTLRYFVRNGGDIRGLEPGKVSKSGLRRMVQAAPEAGDGETRVQRGFSNAESAVLRAAARLARGDPEDARGRVVALIEQLQELVEQLPEQPTVGETTVVGTRAGVRTDKPGAMLHRGA